MLIRVVVLATLLTATFGAFVPKASAQEILLATPETALDSVQDNPIGGDAEMVIDTPFISLQSTREWRAFAEYDVSAAAGAVLNRAEFSGDIAVNNALDRGTRTIEISVYDADGTVTLDDFDKPVTVLGSVSYAPPADTRVSFSYDVATEVETLLAAGATHVGFRARSINPDAPNVLASLVFELATNCGNGAVDAPEECDDGSANSDTTPDACRTDCTLARCGDGVMDTGEACDDGPANGPGAPCSATCTTGADDAGATDAGPDSSVPDASPSDATVDARLPDASAPDAAPADAALVDGSMPPPRGDASCACRIQSANGRGSGALVATLLVFACALRLRRRP